MGTTPHDALFKTIFSEPARAAGIVRAVLPPDLVRRLDLASLELVPGEFVDKELDESRADLMFRAKLDGREAFLWLLFEHRSSPDRLLPLVMLRYMVRIWDDWLAHNPKAEKLPAILPVLFTHAEGGWKAPVQMSGLYDLDAADLEAFRPWIPDFTVALDDVSAEDDARLRERVMDALAKLTMLLFKYARTDPDLVERIKSWSDLVQEAARAPGGVAALAVLWRYAVQVGVGVGPRRLARALEAAAPRAAEAAMTVGERLIEHGRRQGLEQGLQQGVQQGLEQGVQQGLQRALLRQLARRFGDPPPATVARVTAADVDQLEEWADRAVTAPTLRAVFGD